MIAINSILDIVSFMIIYPKIADQNTEVLSTMLKIPMGKRFNPSKKHKNAQTESMHFQSIKHLVRLLSFNFSG